MTKRREPITFERALTTIATAIGWDVCAATVGRNERTVRSWSEPDIEAEVSILDAHRLDAAFMKRGGTYAPFHQVYALRLDIGTAQPGNTSLTELAGVTAKESGKATAAILSAAIDPTPAKVRQARQLAEQAITAFTASVAQIDRNGAGEITI